MVGKKGGKMKEQETCPDCGKILKKGEHIYKMYRDRYKSKKHPEGGLYVCKNCYVGK